MTQYKHNISISGTGFQPVRTFKIYKRNLPHWEEPGRVYFITFRTVNGLIFHEETRKIVFDSIMFHNNKKYKLYACVVMPDHTHFILRPLEKIKEAFYSIAEIMHSIKSYSSNKINHLLKRKGSVWLDENFDRIVRDEKELLEKMNYIANNPIKSGIIQEGQDYKWLYIEGWSNNTQAGMPVPPHPE